MTATSANDQAVIGILGGTFDPVHNGHLRVALDVLETAGLDELRLLPLGQAVHREQPHATTEQRLAMLQLAVAGQPRLQIDQREIARPGPSYMVDTLQSLRDELGSEPLALLLGEDAFAGFLRWRQPERICQLAHLIVMSRPGGPSERDPALDALVAQRRVGSPDELRRRAAGHLLFVPVTPLDIASSDIRARLRAARSADFLLPPPVLDYIHRQGLYRSATADNGRH